MPLVGRRRRGCARVDALVTLTLLALGEPSFGRSEQLQLSHADAEPDDHAARAVFPFMIHIAPHFV